MNSVRVRGASVNDFPASRSAAAGGIAAAFVPPEPLVAILALIESIRDATAVIVHHERDPQMLYPELAEIGWKAERIDGAPGEVRLKLERAP